MTIKAPAGQRAIFLSSFDSLTIEDMTVKGNSSYPGQGGVIYAGIGAELTLNEVTVRDGEAQDGGGVYGDDDSVLNITGGSIRNCGVNNPAGMGGAIAAGPGASLTMMDVDIRDSTAQLGGCVAADVDAQVDLTLVTMDDCSAEDVGGCFYGAASSDSTFTDVDVTDCAAQTGGGMAILDAASLFWTNGTLADGTAQDFGGGIYAEGFLTVLDLDNVTIEDHTVGLFSGFGGGIYAQGGVIGLLTDVTIDDNFAETAGGGLYLFAEEFNPFFVAEGGTMSDNVAAYGGGAGVSDRAFLFLQAGHQLDNNLAERDGGGAWVAGGGNLFVTGEDSTIVRNEAERGGGVFLDGSDGAATAGFTITDAGVIDNVAVTGGGLYLAGLVEAGTASFAAFFGTADLSDNDAGNAGGAYVGEGGALSLFNETSVERNTAVDGGGVQLAGTVDARAALVCDGVPVIAQFTDEPVGGVRFKENAGTGSAIHAVFADLSVESTVFAGQVDGPTVSLSDASDMSAVNTFFWGNPQPFAIHDSDLFMESDFETCDPLDFFAFDADRYCSEISFGNRGPVLAVTGTSDVRLRTTAVVGNDTVSALVDVGAGSYVEFQTAMVHSNGTDVVDPDLVLVQSGGTFDSRQSSFGDNTRQPIHYLSGASGEIQRTAAFDDQIGLGIEIDPGALVGGDYNIGDWTAGALPDPTNLNNTDPGWATTLRGELHLDCGSTVLDASEVDGPFDIEGAVRPFAATAWDVGAIELTLVCP